MRLSTAAVVAALAGAGALVWSLQVRGQTTTPLETHLVLVRTPDGFVAANADGTMANAPYVVPTGQELCVTDVVWAGLGTAGDAASVGLANRNIDGVSLWMIWQDNAVLDAAGDASGDVSFSSAPKIAPNGGITPYSSGLTGLGMTLYAIQRTASAEPCG